VIVDSAALVEREGGQTPTRPFDLEAPAFVTDPAVRAIAADRRLADLLGGDAAPALRAQRFLAALSVIAFEDPETARAITVINPRGLDVPTGVLEAALSGLRGHPWLTPMSVDTVFNTIPAATSEAGGTVVRELAASNPPTPPVTVQQYNDAWARLAAFRTFAPGAAGTGAAQRALLTSVSADWTGPSADEGPERLDAVDAIIDGFLARINVPAPSTITLTDRSGDIPLTIRNSTGQPVKVLIVLESQKLSFPKGSEQIVDLPRRNTTVRFAVESRTSGSFPLSLTVHSVDGGLTIAQARFRVEATAVSTVGLVLIVGAGTFLALWWLLHIRRERHRRRHRQPVPAT
jgi:hypothetical protein